MRALTIALCLVSDVASEKDGNRKEQKKPTLDTDSAARRPLAIWKISDVSGGERPDSIDPLP